MIDFTDGLHPDLWCVRAALPEPSHVMPAAGITCKSATSGPFQEGAGLLSAQGSLVMQAAQMYI